MNNHKNSGGNTMSSTNSATARRRLSLMAGSSLVAAGIAAAASFTVVAAPSTASAQAVCVPAPTSGSGTNSVAYSGALYVAGITCTANGDMIVGVTSNGVDIGAAGVRLIDTDVDDVIFSSTIEIDGNGLTGALINATTNSGTISINAQNLDADQTAATNMTHGVLATSTSGDILMNITGTIDAEASNANLNGRAGIEATTGGAGDISITANAVQGRLYGIRAATTGSGDVTLNLGGNIDARETAAIDVTTGTGDFTLQMNRGEIRGQANAGAIRATFGGDATLSFNVATAVRSDVWAFDITNAAGSLTTVNSNSIFGSRGGQRADFGRKTFRGAGAGDYEINVALLVGNEIVGNSAGNFVGLVDFTAATGDVDLNVMSGISWRFEGLSTFGGGDDTLSMSEGGMVQGMYEGITIDFGDGDDAISNSGFLVSGFTAYAGFGDERDLPPMMNFENLETFNNSGTIILGGPQAGSGYTAVEAATSGTDGTPRSILSMPNTTFTGSGDSLILLDVNFNGSQASCDASLRNDIGFMPAADCIAIQGGATAGVTRVRIHDMVAGDPGSNNQTGIVLVDVSGGTGATGDFIIDPESDGYSTIFGGVIDKGMYFFPLVFDPDTQQHKLVSVMGQTALQFPLLAGAVQSLWRISTGSWFDRQADLRGGIEEGIGGGMWLRATGENAERTVLQTIEGAGNTFNFDNSFEQKSYSLTGGIDLLSASTANTAFVVGFMAGYAHSDIEYDASPNIGRLDGWTGGLYGSFLSGGLFVDAAVNANKLVMDDDAPGLGLFPAGTILSTDLVSVGAQVEAGWRFPVMGNAFIEPLASVSYVRSTIEDIGVAADDPVREKIFVIYDDPTSLRGALGARFGLDQDYGVVRAQYSLLGRVWNEFEDGNAVTFQGPGDDAFAADEFTGQVSEFGVGVSLYGLSDAVSGFASFGGKFGDDYNSQNGSLGVRVAW